VNRVIHFEIHAEDPQRAISFYSGLFGWKFTRWSDQVEYWAVETGPKTEPGIDGGLLPRKGSIDGQAVIAYICTIGVRDLDQIVKTAQAAGGTVSAPRMAIPGIGWLAYLKDTEGNSLGVMQSDPSAR
jgi:predicted enzyme related to lactoylglutathione lyase